MSANKIEISSSKVRPATYEVVAEGDGHRIKVDMPFYPAIDPATGQPVNGPDGKPMMQTVAPKSLIHASSGGFQETGILVGGKMLKASINLTTSK
jgi:hypothetical protein